MDPHKDEVFKTLVEFGFEQYKIEAGWQKAPIKTVEGIIDYLENHEVPLPGSQPAEPHPAQDGQPSKTEFVQNISHLVKQEVVKELVAQGHPVLVAEKATLLSGNKDTASALEWIAQNKNSPDFADPIQVEVGGKASTLDPEEAKQKAIELQKQIRQKILDEEKKNALESEKLRVKMTKEMLDTKRVMDEQRQKQAMDEYLRQKQKDEADKAEMIRIMEEDKIRRFGKLPQHVEKPKSTQEKFNELYAKLYKAYRLGQIDTLKGCIGLVKLYIDNIIKNPAEEKFRKIKSSNPKFTEKVKDVAGGVPLLNLIGFVDEGEFFVLHNLNVAELSLISGLIDAELQKIS